MQGNDEIEIQSDHSTKLYISHSCNRNHRMYLTSSGCSFGTEIQGSWPQTMKYEVNSYIYFRSPNGWPYNLECKAEYTGLTIKHGNPNSGPNWICVNNFCVHGSVSTTVDDLKISASCTKGDHNQAYVNIECR